MRIQDLTCGDVCQNPTVDGPEGWATVMGNGWHPVYPGMRLVIWHMAWEKGEQRWSFDALSPLMVIDHQSPYVVMTTEQKRDNFRKILKLQTERKK